MKKAPTLESKQHQIRRKLAQSGISRPEEFQEVIASLITQRERLESDLHSLRDKVIALQEKQARKEVRPKRKELHKPAHKVLNQKQELARKYDELKQWQKRSVKTMNNSAADSQYRAYLDKLFNIQQQIQLQLKHYNDEKATYSRLKKAMKVINQEQSHSQQLQQGIEKENHLLKKRIGSLKKIVDRQMIKEIDLHHCLIDMREKQKQVVHPPRREISSRQKTPMRMHSLPREQPKRPRNITEADNITISSQSSKSQQYYDAIPVVPQQLLSQEQVYKIEGHLNRMEGRFREDVSKIQRKMKQNYPNEALTQRREGSKLTYGKQFELTFEHCKSNLNLLSQLSRHKIKLLLQRQEQKEEIKQPAYTSTSLAKGLLTREIEENYYSKSKSARKLKNILSQQPIIKQPEKDVVIYPRTFAEQQAQTDNPEYLQQSLLRREFVGTLTNNKSTDRSLLKAEINSSIKTLHIYYTDRGIASVQAVYNLNSEDTTLTGLLSLPASFVANYCKVHTIDTTHQDFIRYFKVRYHILQQRVTSVKIVTNRNIKNSWSESKIKGEEELIDQEVEKDLVFDINKDEFPVSILCSHIQKGPYWYLSGFGVEVNSL